MMFRTGSLEVTSEIRSVPLGEKRKKGRPKKIQHCLSRSPPVLVRATEEDVGPEVDEEPFSPPVSGRASEDDAGLVVDEEPVSEEVSLQEDEVIDLGVKTRKRKHQGLGSSKPPKKKPRLPVPITTQVPTSNVVTKPSRKRKPATGSTTSGTSSTSAGATSAAAAAVSDKPVPRRCKKRLGSCNHEIVFDDHYDRIEWNLYADKVRSAKSCTAIDPDYMA